MCSLVHPVSCHHYSCPSPSICLYCILLLSLGPSIHSSASLSCLHLIVQLNHALLSCLYSSVKLIIRGISNKVHKHVYRASSYLVACIVCLASFVFSSPLHQVFHPSSLLPILLFPVIPLTSLLLCALSLALLLLPCLSCLCISCASLLSSPHACLSAFISSLSRASLS